MNIPAATINNAISCYLSSPEISVFKASLKFGMMEETLRKKIKERGLIKSRGSVLRGTTRTEISTENLNKIVQGYKSGLSVNKLAKDYGLTRIVVTARLRAAGVRLRGQTEANRLAMSTRTPEENRRNTVEAHKAVRGSRRTLEQKRQHAKSIERAGRLGSNHERTFFKLCKNRATLIPQKAIETRNVDFAVKGLPVAVEIFGSGIRGSLVSYQKHFVRRTLQIRDAGYSLVIIWATEDVGIQRGCVDEVVRICEIARTNPSALREHYVIFGNGKTTSFGSDNLDYLTGKLGADYAKC